MKIKLLLISLSIIIIIILLSLKANFLNLNEYFFSKLSIKSKVILRNIKKNNRADNQGTSRNGI